MRKPSDVAFALPPQRDGWLFKSEPQTFSFDDLENSPQATTVWEGVRNYQARNRLRDEVRVGDRVLFYHSSCATPGLVGVAKITRAAYPDPTQFDPRSPYFDPRSTPAKPRWVVVDVKAIGRLKKMVARHLITAHPGLATLELCRRGSRLSIQKVDAKSWPIMISLADGLA